MNKAIASIALGGALLAAALGLAEPPAHADSTCSSDGCDRDFADLLAGDGTLFNLPLEKMEGLQACRDLASGRAPNGAAAVYDLQVDGAYPHDIARSIVASAITIYCPNVHY